MHTVEVKGCSVLVSNIRGVGSNFELVGRKVKGEGPGEEEVGGSPFLPPPP